MTEENLVVEELPSAPDYYKNIDWKVGLAPPAIPEGSPYVRSYNGLFTEMFETKYKNGVDFKSELQSNLKSIMSNALELVSYQESNIPIEHKIASLKSSLVIFHETLQSYRLHEGREVLIETLERDVEELKKMELELTEAIEN